MRTDQETKTEENFQKRASSFHRLPIRDARYCPVTSQAASATKRMIFGGDRVAISL
jgi:hypothetical protein